jgi:hypothetical protein
MAPKYAVAKEVMAKTQTQKQKLVLKSAALVEAKLKHDTEALSAVRDEMEKLIEDSGFLAKAPFKSIALTLRFGHENQFAPVFEGLNKKRGDLAVAVEVDVQRLNGADVDAYKTLFRIATSEALLHVAIKYELIADKLVEYRQQLPAPGH